MPISSTAASGSSTATAGVSSAKWAATMGVFQPASSATSQDTVATLSVAVTSGQVVRYHYEYANGQAGMSMPLYFGGVTLSGLLIWETQVGTSPATPFLVTPVVSGNTSNGTITSLTGTASFDYDVVTSSAGTLSMWIGWVNTGTVFALYRRASIQIIG